MAASDIKNIEAEAGVIASVVLDPELIFFSEQLRPNHFTNPQNAYVYFAVQELAKKGIENIDAYNLMNILNMYKGTEHVGNDATRIRSRIKSVARCTSQASVRHKPPPPDALPTLPRSPATPPPS